MVDDDSGRSEESAATRLGRGVGRVGRKIRDSRPGAETAARGAIEAARPAAERARDFVRQHQDEIKQAGAAGARIAAQRAAPPALRPAIAALDEGLSRRPTRPASDAPGESEDAADRPPDLLLF